MSAYDEILKLLREEVKGRQVMLRTAKEYNYPQIWGIYDAYSRSVYSLKLALSAIKKEQDERK